MNRRRYLGTVGTTGALALAGCLTDVDEPLGPTVREEVDRSVDASGLSAIQVDARVGDVDVHPTAGDQVTVHAEKRTRLGRSALSRVRLETETTGDTLTVRTVYTGDFPRSTPTVDLEVGVPTGADLQVESIALDVGSVTVESVAGPLDVQSDVGSVTVEAVTGDVFVRSDAGEVTVRDVAGYVTASVDVGDVSIRDVDGVDGVNADVGDVEVEIERIRKRTEVSTDVGEVSARLGPDLDADLRVEAGVGDVDASGLTLAVEESSSGLLVGTLGEGGRTLEISTNTGDVVLRSL